LAPKKNRLIRAAGVFLEAVFIAAVLATMASASVVYSLDDCLEIASHMHPGVAGAEASVASSRGRLAQTAAADRLTVDGTVSTARSDSGTGARSAYSAGANASVRLYDANRNKYSLDASRATLSATELEAEHTTSGIRAGVKSAYLILLLSYETERQREDSVEAFSMHLEQARGFYEAGSKPWYDVTKAEVDLGNAQMSLAEASSNLRNARASLANAMGLDPSEDFDIERSTLDIFSVPNEAIRDAEELAVESRPDYLASALKMDAGRATLSAEARSDAAVITLSGGYGGSAVDSFDFGAEWNTRVNMSIPIADGGAAKARADIARANVTSLESSREKLRQDILLEVSRAKSDIEKARERIRISGLTLLHAEENRKLAEGRYEAGVGTALEVTDALVSYTDAILASRQAEIDLQTAIVNLERAIGLEFGR